MPGGGMPGGAPTGGGSDDKDGPAEAAPKDKGALTPIVPVPAQPEGRRRLQLFELHGNLRMRADYFHRLDLDLGTLNPDFDGVEHKFFEPPAQQVDPPIDGLPQVNDASCFERLQARGVSQTRSFGKSTDWARSTKSSARRMIRPAFVARLMQLRLCR